VHGLVQLAHACRQRFKVTSTIRRLLAHDAVARGSLVTKAWDYFALSQTRLLLAGHDEMTCPAEPFQRKTPGAVHGIYNASCKNGILHAYTKAGRWSSHSARDRSGVARATNQFSGRSGDCTDEPSLEIMAGPTSDPLTHSLAKSSFECETRWRRQQAFHRCGWLFHELRSNENRTLVFRFLSDLDRHTLTLLPLIIGKKKTCSDV
jgi:hypothetical protein